MWKHHNQDPRLFFHFLDPGIFQRIFLTSNNPGIVLHNAIQYVSNNIADFQVENTDL